MRGRLCDFQNPDAGEYRLYAGRDQRLLNPFIGEESHSGIGIHRTSPFYKVPREIDIL